MSEHAQFYKFLFNSLAVGLSASLALEWTKLLQSKNKEISFGESVIVYSFTILLAYYWLHLLFDFKL